MRRDFCEAHFAGSKSGGKYLLRTLRSPCSEEMHQTERRRVFHKKGRCKQYTCKLYERMDVAYHLAEMSVKDCLRGSLWL